MSNFLKKPIIVEKPWGFYEKFIENEKSTVKILTIKAHEAFSLQYHEHRSEFWYVISGEGEIVIGDESIKIEPKKSYIFPEKTKHRVIAGENDVVLLEISIGDFNEDDIVRLEDKYGRV